LLPLVGSIKQLFSKKADMKKNGIEVISLSTFDEADVIQYFGIKPSMDASKEYKDWEQKAEQVSLQKEETEYLKELQEKLIFYIRGWNETELREKFIAQVLEKVNFDNPKLGIASFSERFIEVEVKNKLLRGKTDWMVAKGWYKPESPFFFLHEYKKEMDSSNDPVGQMLAAMYIAKLLKHKKQRPTLFDTQGQDFKNVPVFGTYILGRFWFFSHLEEKQYFISKAYDSTKVEDLYFIFRMLKAQKNMIFALVEN